MESNGIELCEQINHDFTFYEKELKAFELWFSVFLKVGEEEKLKAIISLQNGLTSGKFNDISEGYVYILIDLISFEINETIK